ncbi:MAG: alcohol dehydrogenase catalytic domain-containing protein, partial [Clostridiales bacterium]|nr:alcohol dehydrogenase catalytic domain-containing protein [Clostridiales bacterium]
MRKIVLNAPGDLQLQESSLIQPMESEMVRVDVSACAICGSDLALLSGKRDLSKEKYFGHEFSGVVTEVAADSFGVQPGTRVASELSRTCGKCWHCINGMPNYCKSMNDALLPGGFSEDTLVRSSEEYSFLSAIPSTVDDVVASLMEPTNCAYHIAMRTAMKPGDNVVIFGIGAMGLIAGIILKSMGAGNVVAVGRRPARLEQVRSTGIFDAVVTNDEKGMEQVREICGAPGADIVIEATGAAPVLVDAMNIARYGGRIVVGSVYSGTVQEFAPLPILRKELSIVGAKGPTTYRKSDGTSAVVGVLERIQSDLRKIIRVYD